MSSPAYQHNGNAVTSERFYQIACNPRRSVAVQACAGAGKTWMLVSRILRALLEGQGVLQPHEILAITFTKKAAGEMRQRLNDWLAEFSRKPPAELEDELRLRGFTEEAGGLRLAEAAEQLHHLYRTVLEAGRPVQIRTFHSWFASLLRSAPLGLLQELGLPSVYELLEDDTEAVPLVWPRFFERLTQTAEPLADFHAAVQAHGRFQTLRALEAALSKRVEFALADEHGVVEASVQPFGQVFPELAALALPDDALLPGGAYRADLDAAAIALGRASAPTFAAKGSELEQALTAGDVPGALAALLTDKGQPRKFSEKVPDIAQVRQAQALAERLQAARRQQQAWQHQQRMGRLTRLLIDEFAALKRERGWIDMNDVERAAGAMLKHSELSGWLQQRLDARVRHLLIDEFQDTSPLQWQALYSWLASYAGSGGGGDAPKVFIVGDPKQSIYRFRRAEPQVFLAAQQFVRAGMAGDLLSCDHTRRNATQVVAVVNSVMETAQAAGEYADFRAHTTASDKAGAVACLPPIALDAGTMPDDETAGPVAWRDSLSTPRTTLEETRRTLECRQAAAWIAGQLAAEGTAPEHIMVLARRRASLTLMQEELRRLQIPALQPEKTQLGDAPEVKDIIALLDALLSPTNDLALAQALKSPLFGCGDDDLVRLALYQRGQRQQAETGGARPSWFSLLQDASLALPALQALAPQLLRWQGWLTRLPPHDALHAIFHDGDVLARFATAAPVAARARVLANLKALLAAALQFDGGRYATPYALVRALKGGRVKAPVSANAHAVQLLTVHGAKGLEARQVLLLDTDGAAAKAETMGVLVDWPGEAEAPTRFSFLASESQPPQCNAEALAIEQAARKREELNALYVAMTRAQHTLMLSSVVPTRPNLGSWWARLQPLAEMMAEPRADAGLPAAEAQHFDKVFALPELPELPALLAAAAAVPALAAQAGAISRAADNSPDDDTEARIGQAMHRLLEQLPLGVLPHAASTPVDLWSDHQLAAIAPAFGLSLAQAAQATAMALAIRSGDAAWAWDAGSIAWHANEVPLVHQGRVLRLDRLVQRQGQEGDKGKDGVWWVLDYKSAPDPLRWPELCEQLAAYRQAVQQSHPSHSVRAAFLTAQGRFFELVDQG